jgi:hypothetical protein
VRHEGRTVRRFESFALIIAGPRHENGPGAMSQQLGHDLHALLG